MPDDPSSAAPHAVQLLVVRHGESEWNALGRWQGQANPKLSARGEEQARLAAESLRPFGVDRVVSSDLDRASRTARIISGILGIGGPILDPGFREIDVGQWSGLTRPEIELRWPQLLTAWSDGRLESTPGGETLEALRARVRAAVRQLLDDIDAASGSKPPTVLVVSHRRAISALEESVGVRPVRAGHLAGRRFTAGPSAELVPGEPLDLLDQHRGAYAGSTQPRVPPPGPAGAVRG